MQLALGPILYYWPRDTVFSFYEAAASWPVDIVYLGETVCSRRHLLRLNDWLELAARLEAAGKTVILSSQALIESESDLKTLRKLCTQEDFMVEANDMGAVRLLAGRVPFVAGATLNVYNAASLAHLARLGACRWVAPVEMSRAQLEQVLGRRPEGVASEVFAFGRMPLAFSARCFTARHYNLSKDDCRFRCLDHEEGLTVRTREGEALFVFNGIQTQSARVANLLPHLDELMKLGVEVLRISPRARATGEVVRAFRDALDGRLTPEAAAGRIARASPGDYCDGYWAGTPGMAWAPAAVDLALAGEA